MTFPTMKPTNIFNIFAMMLIIISLILGMSYKNTQKEIIQINHKANIKYLQSLSDNLKLEIIRILQKNFVYSMAHDFIAKEYIESNLKLFVTTKYKYIYLIAKKDNNFIYLTQPQGSYKSFVSNKQRYMQAWNLKKSFYFETHKDKDVEGIYISPIIVKHRVEALLVVKFSLKEKETLVKITDSLGKLFAMAFGFFSMIFIAIVWFSIVDKRREEQKNIVFGELQKANIVLSDTTNKLSYLNSTLEMRVQEEVNKNRIKDVQLLHQARLAQMGEMLSMIAHQWRQPLNAISATSTSLSLKTKLGKLENTYVLTMTQKILEYVEHLSDTINDFRNFFKPIKEKKITNYKELIDSVDLLISESLINQNILFFKEITCEDKFLSYPNELKQVILNLIKNAEDILIEKKVLKPYIKLTTSSVADNNILEVKDNGGGVDAMIIDKIFDPYFSTKLEKDGTGLGLYMSKIIVEEHCGGQLLVQNDENGAVFTIILGKSNE